MHYARTYYISRNDQSMFSNFIPPRVNLPSFQSQCILLVSMMLTTAHTCSYSKVIGIIIMVLCRIYIRFGIVMCVNNRCDMHSAVAIMQLHCMCIIHAQCIVCACALRFARSKLCMRGAYVHHTNGLVSKFYSVK